MNDKLFPIGVPEKTWCKFPAAGYALDAVGLVYRAGQAACGLPLGGIGTGYVDLDTDGTLGRCTMFNTVIPPRELGGPLLLWLTVDSDVWALTTKSVTGAKNCNNILYWGHYPVADMQYECDAPVAVSLRAWTPFLPGDAATSNTPAAIFEVAISNVSAETQRGSVTLTFPGPDREECGWELCRREGAREAGLSGILVRTGERSEYFLGAVGVESVRIAGDLNAGEGSCTAAPHLPEAPGNSAGASAAVDFGLDPGESKLVRFILAWYYPLVTVNDRHQYVHAYGSRFSGAVDAAASLASNHEKLLARVIAWQQVIYGEECIPLWLRDCLVNNFHLIAEDGFWESNSIPEEAWAREHGMFSMVESTRTCPGQACIPSDWFGNLSIVYFFPELAHYTLRGFAHYQLPNGEIPIYFGQMYERQNPVYQLLHLTSPCNYVDLVDRLWQRTSDDSILYEFYPSVRSAINYLKSLDMDADGIIDCQVGALAHQFYGLWNWYGAATHVAGMWLSVLAIAERMAERVGDTSFVRDCQVWRKMGRLTVEYKLWNGDYYLLYNDTTSGRKDDTILGDQLAGLWSCRLHGVEDVFPADHVQKTLETVKAVCFPAAKYGSATARRPDGVVNPDGAHQSTDVFLGECMVLANTMAYAGERETGIEIARQLMEAIVLEYGRAWDMPGFLDNDTGEPSFGADFDQMMSVWSLPSAIANQPIGKFVASGGLVDRIMRAAAEAPV